MLGRNSDMKLPLTTIPLTSRDGTLAKDSHVTNTVGGQKRPGLVTKATLPVGNSAQGLFTSSTLGPLAINGNKIYSVDTSALVVAIFDVPSATGGVGPYSFTAPLPSGLIAFHDQRNVWTLLGNVITLVARWWTAAILPGFVYLDGSYYILLEDGSLCGSGGAGYVLNDPTLWSALNVTMLNADLGTAKGIARQANYIMAFGDSFSVMYYDAGNPPPGSPLSIAQNTYSDVGCPNARSIAEMGTSLFFIGTSQALGRNICIATGSQIQPISTPDIERILEKTIISQYIDSYTLKIMGAELYVLLLYAQNITLVYNITTKQWAIWTSSTTAAPDPIVANSYNQALFGCAMYVGAEGMNLLQHYINGKVYRLDTTVFQDEGLPIDVSFITPQLEGQTSDFLRIGAAEVVGDKVVSPAYIQYTDDDYQNWSTYQAVDLAASRSQTVRQGSTRRRAYHIRHTANTALNLRELLLDVMPQ